jgi:hypothetical protein
MSFMTAGRARQIEKHAYRAGHARGVNTEKEATDVDWRKRRGEWQFAPVNTNIGISHSALSAKFAVPNNIAAFRAELIRGDNTRAAEFAQYCLLNWKYLSEGVRSDLRKVLMEFI